MSIQKNTITEINRLHGEIETALRQSLSNAVLIGQRLDEVKRNLQHGEFTAFITGNLSFSVRTAQRYLKLFQNRGPTIGSTGPKIGIPIVDHQKRHCVAFAGG